MDADGDGFGRRLPSTTRCSGSGAGRWGCQGGTAPFGQTAVFKTASAGRRTLRVTDSRLASAPDGLRRRESRIGGISIPEPEEGRAGACQLGESRRFPEGCSAVPDATRPPPAASPPLPQRAGREAQSLQESVYWPSRGRPECDPVPRSCRWGLFGLLVLSRQRFGISLRCQKSLSVRIRMSCPILISSSARRCLQLFPWPFSWRSSCVPTTSIVTFLDILDL